MSNQIVMKNQVIKKRVDIFDDFVKTNFPQENNYYILNLVTYKKNMYENTIDAFVEQLKNYYFHNKQYYINRVPITYKNFTTIIRQICKMNNIVFEIYTKYDNSKYSPEYRIFV